MAFLNGCGSFRWNFEANEQSRRSGTLACILRVRRNLREGWRDGVFVRRFQRLAESDSLKALGFERALFNSRFVAVALEAQF